MGYIQNEKKRYLEFEDSPMIVDLTEDVDSVLVTLRNELGSAALQTVDIR
jgi:hypothetical protein